MRYDQETRSFTIRVEDDKNDAFWLEVVVDEANLEAVRANCALAEAGLDTLPYPQPRGSG